MTQVRPIETAPKERGARFLVWGNIYRDPKPDWHIAERNGRGRLWIATEQTGGEEFIDTEADVFTHWAPLPPEPEQ